MIKGEMLIGAQSVSGNQASIHGINPATNQPLEPAYAGGSLNHVNQAAELADAAFDIFRETSLDQRAGFLESIADEIMALGEQLVERAMLETGLPKARIEGERGRTVAQLRLFAEVVRTGHWLGARLDSALPERTPPRSDIRMRYIPLGPVGVFGASNFPLAFSVAGGDTASAFAAGCPVIVKAHSAHPGTSELVGRAIQLAVKKAHLPEGVFSLLYGSGQEIGVGLVQHPLIKGIGFTGSRSGGVALMNVAAARPEPIPVYAEMSSINPVFLMPEALRNRADTLASGFVTSLSMGAGQFCTNPGLVIAIDGDGLDTFLKKTAENLAQVNAQTMLTPGIYNAYRKGISHLQQHSGVKQVAIGLASIGENQCVAGFYETTAAVFLQDDSLTDEIFGASSLLIRCQSVDEYLAVAKALEGQLTATVQMDTADFDQATPLLTILERKAGRILCNGYPTGVEVCHAMVHGGPFPSTSDSRTTSVGSAAIQRFLRPVCYQDWPTALLPTALKDDNPYQVKRLINGQMI